MNKKNAKQVVIHLVVLLFFQTTHVRDRVLTQNNNSDSTCASINSENSGFQADTSDEKQPSKKNKKPFQNKTPKKIKQAKKIKTPKEKKQKVTSPRLSLREQKQQAREKSHAVSQEKAEKYKEYKKSFANVQVSNYGTVSYGFTKYIVPSESWFTTASTIDGSFNPHDAYLSTNKTRIMPLVRGALGLQFSEIPCWFNPNRKRVVSLALEVSYAKRNDVYKATYFDLLRTPSQGPLTAYQDANRATVMFTGSFDMLRSRSGVYGANLDLGVGLITGSLKNLQLYDLNTQVPRGEYLPNYKWSAVGFVGLSFVRTFDQSGINLDLSYRVVINKVQYQSLVIRTVGALGSETNPTGTVVAPLSVPQFVGYRLGAGNKLYVYSNEFTLALSKLF